MRIRLGPYRILERLSVGAAGITYLAVRDHRSSTSPLLCIKTPHPHFAADSPYLESFRTEARVASLLRHPHIVPLYDVGDEDGIPYLVLAFVEGLDLGELIHSAQLAHEQLAWEVVAQLAEQIAHALEYAHAPEKGTHLRQDRPAVIHRDVCPANIIISLHGMASLTDFGIAKAIEQTSLDPSLAANGRFAYCAPERLVDGCRYDARADLFSLGVVLFEALTNRKPFRSRSFAEHIHHVLHEPIPRIEPLRAEFHPSYRQPPPEGLVRLVEIVHRLLASNPDDRFSARELVNALGQLTIPADAHRQLAAAATDHLPAQRRHVRLRTAKTPAVHQQGEHSNPWKQTGPVFKAEIDGVLLSANGAQRLLDSTLSEHEPPSVDTRPLGSGDTEIGATEIDDTDVDRPVISNEPPPDFPINQQPVLAFPSAAAQPDAPQRPVSTTLLLAQTQLAPQPPRSPLPPPSRTPHGPTLARQPTRTPRARSRLLAAAAALGILFVAALCVASAVAVTISGARLVEPQQDGRPSSPSAPFVPHEDSTFAAYPPIFADINDDQVQDLIGLNGTASSLIAASGRDVEPLWTYPLPDNDPGQSLTFAAPSHQLIVHIDGHGHAVGIDGRSGEPRWRAELGERVGRTQPVPCVTSDNAYVRSVNNYWFAIHLDSGTTRESAPPDGECDPREPLGYEGRLDRTGDCTRWPTYGFRAQLRGDDAHWRRGWLLPEQPRLLVEGSAQSPSGRAVPVLALFETHLDRRQRPRPSDLPLWQTFIAERTDIAAAGTARNLTAHGNHFFVVYDTVRARADAPERVGAFDLRSGARLWDTALERNPGPVHFIFVDSDRVWIGHGGSVEVLDRRAGQHLGRVGEWR